MNKIVLFNLRRGSRLRMRDTPLNLKIFGQIGVELDTGHQPDISTSHGKDQEFRRKLSIRNFVKKIYNICPIYLINVQRLDKPSSDKLVYNWGSFSISPLKNQIIEFDNPYCITFYNINAFRFFLPILFFLFRKVHALTFMSQASLELFSQEMGKNRYEQISKKCHVFYPIVKVGVDNKRKQRENVRFLFVGLDPVRKGLNELICAFEKFAQPQSSLTIISPFDSDGESCKKLNQAKTSEINFIGTVSRSELLNEIMPSHDILVVPSYQESFGMVYLEALSLGLGLIALDNFAISELIEDKKNGCIITNPVIGHHPDVKTNRDLVKVPIPKFNAYLCRSRDILQNRIEHELGRAINYCEANASRMSAESQRIYMTKFAKNCCLERWKKVVECH